MGRRFAILVCKGPECGEKRHSEDLHAAFTEALGECPLRGNEAMLDTYSCFGKCRRGPNVLVREIRPSDNPAMIRLMPTSGGRAVLYHGVGPAEVRRIVEGHVAQGQPVTELIRRVSPSAAGSPPDKKGTV